MVYIQSKEDVKLPHHSDVASAMFGCEELGIDYELISFTELQTGKFDHLLLSNPFLGTVEFMKEVFLRMGIKYDVKVPRNSNRASTIKTIGEIKKNFTDFYDKVFIKPIDIKLFTGFVLDVTTTHFISDINDDVKVLVYDIIDDIVSESRCYIHMNRIIDVKNYSGDMFLIPDERYIKSIIDENKDFPIAYTIDVGITKTGEYFVVEFNDMWAIGNYGVPNSLYFRLLKARYFEIVKNRHKLNE